MMPMSLACHHLHLQPAGWPHSLRHRSAPYSAPGCMHADRCTGRGARCHASAKQQAPAKQQAGPSQQTRKQQQPRQRRPEPTAAEKELLGKQQAAHWVAASGITPLQGVPLEDLKHAQVRWQDAYKAKTPGSRASKKGKKPAKGPTVQPSSSSGGSGSSSSSRPADGSGSSPPRGFGVLSDRNTLKVFRYGVEKAPLQDMLLEARLAHRVVQVERVEEADAILAIKLTKKGSHINMQQAERTAANAGIPLLVAGRRLSRDSLLRALQPLVGDLPGGTPSPGGHRGMGTGAAFDSNKGEAATGWEGGAGGAAGDERRSSRRPVDDDDGWDELEPADEFELWDPEDLASGAFDEQPPQQPSRPRPLKALCVTASGDGGAIEGQGRNGAVAGQGRSGGSAARAPGTGGPSKMGSGRAGTGPGAPAGRAPRQGSISMGRARVWAAPEMK